MSQSETSLTNGEKPIPEKCIAFVAAGSGGHIQSALAVLEYITAQYPKLAQKSVFVGSNLNMEGEVKKVSLEEALCKRMGIPFVKIRGGKLQRNFSLRSLRLLGGVISSFIDAWMFFSKYKPSLVVSFGGYSSLPMGVIAWLRRVKLIIHEQTTNVGLTNNILMKIADVSAISYQQSLPYFKNAKKIIMTGSPSRSYIFSVQNVKDLWEYLSIHPTPLAEQKEYIERLKYIEEMKSKHPLILVMGGSQGSHIINSVVGEIMADLAKDNILFVQTGDNQVYKDYDKLIAKVASLPVELQKNIFIRKFIYEEMGFLYHYAKLSVGRSGANSVYEVGMMGIPAIFIPIPWVTKNEQYTNAKIVEDLGFGKIIEQDKLTPEILLKIISEMKTNVSVPAKEKLQNLFPKNAAEKLTNEILNYSQ